MLYYLFISITKIDNNNNKIIGIFKLLSWKKLNNKDKRNNKCIITIQKIL